MKHLTYIIVYRRVNIRTFTLFIHTLSVFIARKLLQMPQIHLITDNIRHL